MLKNSIKILICLLSFVFVSNVYAKADETYDALKMMIDVMELIKNNYVEETQSKDLVIGAINGVVRTLDPYSQFMDEKAYKEMKTETQGSFGGVGIRITMQDGSLTIITPMPDTPAYSAGILPEDKIIKIDDKSTENMSMDEAVKLMRGNPGTKVKLTIYRPSTKEELEFDLKRKKIKIETVKKQMLEDNIGYIRLSEFNAQSAADVKKMLGELSKEGMKAFIFDLRNNPGGLLDAAVNICELFIKEESIVVSTKGREGFTEQNYYTKSKPVYPDLPVVVLINRGSASASEIVTGTLQDYKRALIIGGNSFGKGSVQTIIPLADGNALKLTIAKYYLPSGRTILKADKKKGTKSGVTPDISIEVKPEIEGKLYMQSEAEKLPPNSKEQEKITDEVLDTAIKVIKAGKVSKYISDSAQYLKDYPKQDKKEEVKKENKEEKDNKKKAETKEKEIDNGKK